MLDCGRHACKEVRMAYWIGDSTQGWLLWRNSSHRMWCFPPNFIGWSGPTASIPWGCTILSWGTGRSNLFMFVHETNDLVCYAHSRDCEFSHSHQFIHNDGKIFEQWHFIVHLFPSVSWSMFINHFGPHRFWPRGCCAWFCCGEAQFNGRTDRQVLVCLISSEKKLYIFECADTMRTKECGYFEEMFLIMHSHSEITPIYSSRIVGLSQWPVCTVSWQRAHEVLPMR